MTFSNKEHGQSSVLAVLFVAIIMIGFLSFAVDVGYMFHMKRMAQAAADAAAVAAAEEDSYAGDSGNAQAAANAAAKMNGFDTTLATNPAVVTLASQGSGSYSSTSSTGVPTSWVQAQVSQPISTFFLNAFGHGFGSFTVSATAVAGGGQSSPTCVCLEGKSGQDLNMSNNASLNATSCGVTADSSSGNAIGIVGSASVCAQSLSSVSPTWDNSGNINNGGSVCSSTAMVQGVTTACGPSTPAVPVDTACSSDPFTQVSGGGVKYTVGPGSTYGTTQGGNTICYNGLTVNGNGDTTTLNAGVYVVNGGVLHFESGTNGGGNGVMFYLENSASMVIDNGANVNLVAGGNTENGGGTASSTGAYNGILVFEDPGNGGSDTGDTQALSIQGGASTYFNGEILAPLAAITLGNGSGSSVNADIVAQTLTMNGGGTLQVTPSANLGTLNLSVAKLSQ
jgi:hypothetical protein